MSYDVEYDHPIDPYCDPDRRGEPAGPKLLFGPRSRFAAYPVHTRFGAFAWFVDDAETVHQITGLPDAVVQASTFHEAIKATKKLRLK